MGRVYKKTLGCRSYAKYDENQLSEAVNAVKFKKITYQAAAELYKIPKKTIWNKVNNKHRKKAGG